MAIPTKDTQDALREGSELADKVLSVFDRMHKHHLGQQPDAAKGLIIGNTADLRRPGGRGTTPTPTPKTPTKR